VTAADIRSPDPRDAESLADLWVALARGQQEHGSHLQAEPNRSRVRDVLVRYAATNRLLVADAPSTASDADGESDVVGFVMFRIRADEYEVDCERGLVENLYVVPDHRGAGIGSDLLSAAEQLLRERGVDVVSLEAIAQNHDARRFYRRHGYEPHRVELERSLEER
jgi:Acetyltransferases